MPGLRHKPSTHNVCICVRGDFKVQRPLSRFDKYTNKTPSHSNLASLYQDEGKRIFEVMENAILWGELGHLPVQRSPMLIWSTEETQRRFVIDRGDSDPGGGPRPNICSRHHCYGGPPFPTSTSVRPCLLTLRFRLGRHLNPC